MSPSKIVIIGAGPAGLTLARLLQQNQIPCVVYEGEPHRHSRNQGGSLDLHRQGGQAALAEAGLTEEFRKISRPEAEMMKILSPTGEVLWDENVTGNWRPSDLADRPEVDRTALRDLLLDSLAPETVQWSRKVERIESSGAQGPQQQKHTIVFTDGSRHADIDLLIGADGAFSKVRPLVTPEQPHYSGITCIELWKLDADRSSAWLAKQVGAGSCYMFDEGRALLAQRQGNDAVRAYACVRQPVEWTRECGIDWTAEPADVARALADGYFADCGADVRRMIVEGADQIVIRHLWMLPVGHTWTSKAGVTVLGDAAHLMTPFAGVGVNTAMVDALDLARQIIAHKSVFVAPPDDSTQQIGRIIHEYEQSMFVRAETMTSKTYAGLQHHFRASGGEEWAERHRKHYAALKEQGIVKA